MAFVADLNKERTAVHKAPLPHGRQSVLPVTPTSLAQSTSVLHRQPPCPCGGACPKCRTKQNIQPKLRIGAPNDKYEQEADRLADQIMRMPQEQEIQDKPLNRTLQRQVLEDEEEPPGESLRYQEEEDAMLTKATPGRMPAVDSHAHAGIQSLHGGGQPLPPGTRNFFESRMERDFSQVRIHVSDRAAAAAQSVNARAFTLGRDVVFNRGEYAPHSWEGRRLLAHELVHVVQQGVGRDVTTAQKTPEFLQRQSATNQASDCSGWEGDLESFTKLIAEHYVADALGTSGRGMSVSCSGTPRLCIWRVKTPNGVISVSVSLANVPHYVIARQVFASGVPRCEYEYVCPPDRNPVFRRRRCN